MSAPTPQDVRHERLDPYLQRVRAFLRARGDENRPLTIPSEPIPLTLSAEERKAAWSVLCDETLAWSDPQAWVALGAGLHLAVATELQAATHAELPGNRGDATQRIDAMRSVAASYTEGLRQSIADMVTGGRADDARRLSAFRNKLLGILALLRGAGAPTPPPVAEATPVARPPADPPPPAERREAGPAVSAPPTADPALGPYLQRAAAFLRARGHDERPLSVSFGRRTLSVSAWERRVLWRSLCEGEAPASEWHRLIPEYIALQLAILLSLDELDGAEKNPEAETTARSSLQAVLRLASGVVDGFRGWIGRSVSAGAVEDAKRLSGLSSAFAATLLDARRALAEGPPGSASAAVAGVAPGERGPTATPPPSGTAGAGADALQVEKLKPFLDRAAQLLEIRGREDRPLSIAVGGRSWNLDPWERQVLWKVLCEEGPPPPDWSLLLAQGAAAHLAALLAMERLRKSGAAPEARGAADADGETATQLASEVVERLRTTADALAADGQEKLAGQLRRFREKLAESTRMLSRIR